MLKILIADDHPVVRQGIRALLTGHEGWQICGEAENGYEAVAKAVELRPDLVILDVFLPEMNGLEVTLAIRQKVPTARILIVTGHDVDDLAERFVEAGAQGYLLKSEAGHALVEAVTAIANRGTFLSPRVRTMIDERTGYARQGTPRASSLTKREREVLQLLAEGKSNKEIAVVMGITAKTVETHRARLMSKLGVHSIAGLVRYAIRSRMLSA